MLAFLCSGQGRQHADMFRLTGAHPAAAPIFDAAQEVLGQDPRELVANDTSGAIYTNRTAQILCVTQVLAAAAMLGTLDRETPSLVAGYSVGELAAWGLARALPPEALPTLAATRAALMDSAGGADGGLAFVRGLGDRQVEALCTATGTALAIVNPDLVCVVGGPEAALDRFVAAARAQGAARADRLDVHTASHTPFLAAGVAPFLDALNAAGPHRLQPGITLLSALDGNRITDPVRQVDGLARQLACTLRWDQCLTAVFERGADAVLELGPGRALAEMAAGMRPDIPARSLEDFRSLDGLQSWLAANG